MGLRGHPPAGTEFVTLDDQTTANSTYFSVGRLDFTSIPDDGKTMTMSMGGVTSTFLFSTAIADRGYRNGTVDNSTTAAGTITDGDTVQIGGVTFTIRAAGPVSNATEIDLSGLTTAGQIATQVAAVTQSYFETRLGDGNWVQSSGDDVQSSLQINAVTGTTLGAPANVNISGETTDNLYTINTNGRSLSQILDVLGRAVNTAAAAALNDPTNSLPLSSSQFSPACIG